MPSHEIKLDLAGRIPPTWTVNIPGFGNIKVGTSYASFVCSTVEATKFKRENGSWLTSDTW